MWTLKSAQTCKLSMFSLYVYLTLINTSSVIYFNFFFKRVFQSVEKNDLLPCFICTGFIVILHCDHFDPDPLIPPHTHIVEPPFHSRS